MGHSCSLTSAIHRQSGDVPCSTLVRRQGTDEGYSRQVVVMVGGTFPLDPCCHGSLPINSVCVCVRAGVPHLQRLWSRALSQLFWSRSGEVTFQFRLLHCFLVVQKFRCCLNVHVCPTEALQHVSRKRAQEESWEPQEVLDNQDLHFLPRQRP